MLKEYQCRSATLIICWQYASTYTSLQWYCVQSTIRQIKIRFITIFCFYLILNRVRFFYFLKKLSKKRVPITFIKNKSIRLHYT